jgi:hypothetical protein
VVEELFSSSTARSSSTKTRCDDEPSLKPIARAISWKALFAYRRSIDESGVLHELDGAKTL